MSLPFALSIHSFVSSVGAYVGLGSLVAVAILTLLYFAHARETATLRERLDEAQQRILGLESRLAQVLQGQGAAARRVPGAAAPGGVTPAPVVPAPAVARPGAASIPSVRRVPSPATAAAGAAPASVNGPGRSTLLPAAPIGVAAPALASATKLIPDPVGLPGGDPDDTMFVPAGAAAAAARAESARRPAAGAASAAPPAPAPAVATAPATAAAANGQLAGEQTAVLASASQPAPVRAAAAPIPSASPRNAGGPPRMRIGAEQEGAAATAAGAAAPAAGRSNIRRIGGVRGQERAAAPLGPLVQELDHEGRFSGRLLPLLIGGIALIVIIAGVIVITNRNNSTTTGQVSHSGTTAAGAGTNRHNPISAGPFRASNVRVAVLNGTAQQGLAGAAANKLASDGYRKGNITNAASQTEASTFVYYVTGAAQQANRIAAQHVARALALPASRVRPAGNIVIQSCSISATGASLGKCAANVIVSVGQDRVNLATGG